MWTDWPLGVWGDHFHNIAFVIPKCGVLLNVTLTLLVDIHSATEILKTSALNRVKLCIQRC